MNSSTNEYIFSYLSTVSLIGTIGNLMVVIVYWRKKDKQTSTFFILVLAFSDLCVCSVLVPLTIYMEKILFETSSNILCKLFFFLTTTIVPSCSLLMSAIAFERYFCICKVNQNIINLKRARFLVIILLFSSALLGIIPLMASTTVVLENTNKTNNSLDNSAIHLCIIDDESKYSHFGFLVSPFKFFYDLIYFVSVFIITLLYILIYKEIYIRRRIKRNRKKELLYSSIVNQAENSIFPNTLLIKNDDDFDNKMTCLDKKCLFLDKILGKKECKEEQVNIEVNSEMPIMNKIEETELDTILAKDKQYESIFPNDLKNEKKIVLNTIKASESLLSNLNKIDLTKINNNVRFEISQKKNKYALKKSRILKKSKSKRKKNTFKRDPTINSKIIPFLILIKDTRTAFMLFVVSIVFITCYLPSILATRSLLPNENLYLIYLYFANSAINPIIYSFMNRSFRCDLIKLFKAKSKNLLPNKLSSITVFSISPDARNV